MGETISYSSGKAGERREMSRKGIAERLQMARRAQERLEYNWWRQIYIEDVSELLPQARALEEKEREVERLREEVEFLHDHLDAEGVVAYGTWAREREERE